MSKLCAFGGCKSLAVNDSSRCEKHQKRFTPKKQYDHHYHDGKLIYSSSRWVKLRVQYLRHNPLCCYCQKRGVITPAVIVDHVKEIADGGEIWDIENLQGLCAACHNTKTGEEVKKRSRRKNTNGFGSLSDF